MVAFRHGLRASEIADLEWSQVEFGRNATFHVRRAKNGKPGAHPLEGDEIRALRELQRNTTGGYVFRTERGGSFTADAVNRLIKRIGERAGFAFRLLSTCCATPVATRWPIWGVIRERFKIGLAIGRIQHTVRYTELSPTRFKGIWRD